MANERTIHTPTVYGSGTTPFAVRYGLDYLQVRALLYELNDNSITGAFSHLYSDPIDNIISLCFFPFTLDKVFTDFNTILASRIEISTSQLQTTGYRIDERVPVPDRVAAPLSLGQIGVSPYYHNFLDYAPYTKVELFLPFIGFETLDTDLVMGKTIKIRYIVDTYTGKCTAYVILVESGDETVIMTRDGQCGVPIQVCGGSGAELARNMLRANVNALTGIAATGRAMASMSPVGAAISAGSFLASSAVGAMDAAHVGVHKGGQQTALTAGYGPLMAYLIYTRPTVAEPSSYAHNYGRPCGKTLTLNTLTGYTQVDTVHVEGSGFATATVGERDEIERLLKTGVLL